MAYEHNPDLPKVTDVIPHRPPSLWLDGVIACNPGESATGFWTPNPKHYAGHFEDIQLLMAVKQVESAAQLGAYTLMLEDPGNILATFKGITGRGDDPFEFKAPVFPGDTLELEVSDFKKGKREFSGFARVAVGGEETASGIIMGTVMSMKVGMRALSGAREARISSRSSE
jgi:3-hydroxyacyl-[acyl-carrier-protein] dehydratase